MADQGMNGAGPKDRKLGDEWTDWAGEADPREREINENASTFLTLASGVLAAGLALLLFTWFMIKPRFEQFSPVIAELAGWIVTGFVACLVLAVAFEGVLLVRRGVSLLPYVWVEKLFLTLLPRTIWIGGKFGISKDRIGNSFLKLHNLVTKGRVAGLKRRRLLVLLPRCLRREARELLTARLHGNDYKVYTAAGGEEARKAIREYRPSAILAVACERDLMSGIKDVADKIPVLAVPNKRPEGPCKNTDISVCDLEEALKVLMPGQEQEQKKAA